MTATGMHRGEHTEHEGHSWEVEIPDHPARTETEGFRRAKKAAREIMATVQTGLLAFLAGTGR